MTTTVYEIYLRFLITFQWWQISSSKTIKTIQELYFKWGFLNNTLYYHAYNFKKTFAILNRTYERNFSRHYRPNERKILFLKCILITFFLHVLTPWVKAIKILWLLKRKLILFKQYYIYVPTYCNVFFGS